MRKTIISAIVLSVGLGTGVQAADLVKASDPLGLTEIIRDLGYRAKLEKDKLGDPMISMKSGSINYSIFFYGCKENTKCTSIQFSASFDLKGGTTTTSMNEWNVKKRYGKAHIDDEKDPILRYDVNMSGAGISRETFDKNFSIWEDILNDFQEHIDW